MDELQIDLNLQGADCGHNNMNDCNGAGCPGSMLYAKIVQEVRDERYTLPEGYSIGDWDVLDPCGVCTRPKAAHDNDELRQCLRALNQGA